MGQELGKVAGCVRLYYLSIFIDLLLVHLFGQSMSLRGGQSIT